MNILPVYIEMSADLLTPVSAYLKLLAASDAGAESFLLESVENGERVGRYSFMGVKPRKTLNTAVGTWDPLVALEHELRQVNYIANTLQAVPDFCGGAVGYLGYECIHYWEATTSNGIDSNDVLKLPDAVLMLFDYVVAFDHVHKVIKVIGNVRFDE